jgi:hypothetical protein
MSPTAVKARIFSLLFGASFGLRKIWKLALPLLIPKKAGGCMNDKQNTNVNQIRNVNQNQNDPSRSDSNSNLSRAKEQLAPKTIEKAPSPGDEQAP